MKRLGFRDLGLVAGLVIAAGTSGTGTAQEVAGPVETVDSSTEVRPPSDEVERSIGLFEHVGSNIVDSFLGINLVWHGLSIVGTVAMVTSDFDLDIQRHFWEGGRVFGDDFAHGTLIAGMFTPLVIPGVVALVGWGYDDSELATGGTAALQAVGIAALVTTLQKIITDRVAPLKNGEPYDSDDWMERTDDPSDFGFNPFSFRGGYFWPSGHTASHMALSSALVAFFQDEIWLPFVVYPMTAVVGLAMVEGDHHWASDVLAGAFIGHAIGWTVGSNTRKRFDQLNNRGNDQTYSDQNSHVMTNLNSLLFVMPF